ncbi:acetate/propionate family kinase [Dasania sp. GY-MA-18]|uniref:Acetate kinase n=1 Tax=Dasania phycosphaerae TaxID=2950436 RepID=A0A9J6RN34_9GAMM|nr:MULTISPECIES: acetate/propionate family kinase [Dasania]MCR8923330.1 acetate/propionate family kinase [Dasania sp. GY-MA-18]MCZ0865762.1 acetate/propionate family kinase [Dasania phycosphaerae]MCZ0869487.1 acetate/propionate family kinase [Dasania phycosphaerae]
MDRQILVLNVGSSSIKFSVYQQAADGLLKVLLSGQLTHQGQNREFKVDCFASDCFASDSRQQWQEARVDNNRKADVARILDYLANSKAGFAITLVGHRVVHGGTSFAKPALINEQVLASLRELQDLAPLHQAHNVDAIAAVAELWPSVKQVACFDTAFHHSMPAEAQTFAIPKHFTEQGIRPYGFHGLSYQYIASILPSVKPKPCLSRVLVAHLGSGASLCAMRDLRSVATTMSFTPLDGLAMATRSGAIDPGVLLYLLNNKAMTVEQLQQLLNHQSGLLGMSGISADLRELLASDHPAASAAVDHYIYRIVLALGSMAAAAGGIDTLVFTAGVGQHCAQVRERVCQQIAWLGVKLNTQANASHAQCISHKDSQVAVYVIATDEALMIAQHCLALDIAS